MSEYMMLYEAIWSEAIRNDIKNLIEQLYKNACSYAYDCYLLNAISPIPLADKRFDLLKEDLKECCKIKARPLIINMRQMLYNEALEWPANKDYKKSQAYKDELKVLKAEIKNYSETRITNRMRYLT